MITRLSTSMQIDGNDVLVSLESQRAYNPQELRNIIQTAYGSRSIAHRDQFLRSKKIKLLEIIWSNNDE